MLKARQCPHAVTARQRLYPHRQGRGLMRRVHHAASTTHPHARVRSTARIAGTACLLVQTWTAKGCTSPLSSCRQRPRVTGAPARPFASAHEARAQHASRGSGARALGRRKPFLPRKTVRCPVGHDVLSLVARAVGREARRSEGRARLARPREGTGNQLAPAPALDFPRRGPRLLLGALPI